MPFPYPHVENPAGLPDRDRDGAADTAPGHEASAPPRAGRPRTATNTAEIDTTLSHPGSVKINVKGAFIVEEESGSPGSDRGSPTRETKDIRLPNHTAVVSHVAVDIGGTLAKLVYFSSEAESTDPGGRLNFIRFETERIDDCIQFIKHFKGQHEALNGSGQSDLCVMATGGGAYKYYDRIRHEVGVDVLREDEMDCLIMGLDFFITEIPREVFTYSETDPMHFATPSDDIYPYLVVNIGSGVSMLKVSGPRKYERVGGTSLGGGTLWGLLSLLTGARTFDEMLDMASRGDNSKVDMLVGDIYGTDYGKIGLKSTAIASSFGKVIRMKRLAEREAEDNGNAGHSDGDRHLGQDGQDEQRHDQQQMSAESSAHSSSQPASSFTGADISRSLLYAVSNNIGQIAFLQSQIHGLSNIYFGGSFIRGHPQTMNTLSYAIKFWSKGAKRAYFLRHEGYLGAVGAFLKRQPRNWGRRGSFDGEVAGQAADPKAALAEMAAKTDRARDEAVVV